MLVLTYTVSAILLALGIYWLFRKLLGSLIIEDDRHLSIAMITRLGTLHALILALIFAAEMHNYMEANKIVTHETASIADVYYGIERYHIDNPKSAEAIRNNIVHYVRAVVDNEWHNLNETSQLSEQAWKFYSLVDESLFRLVPDNEYQAAIKKELLADWDEVSQHRREREATALREVPGFFWVLAITGFVLVVIPYSVFKPRLPHILFLVLFSAYNGMTFAFVLELSEPFSGVGIIEPTLFQKLYARSMTQAE